MEVCNFVQEAVSKTIPKKQKCNNAKWLSEKDLQRDEKRREAKHKGQKGKYTHLNAESKEEQGEIKKALLSEQCKKIEESNTMGKTRDVFKKIRESKGTFHVMMGT